MSSLLIAVLVCAPLVLACAGNSPCDTTFSGSLSGDVTATMLLTTEFGDVFGESCAVTGYVDAGGWSVGVEGTLSAGELSATGSSDERDMDFCGWSDISDSVAFEGELSSDGGAGTWEWNCFDVDSWGRVRATGIWVVD